MIRKFLFGIYHKLPSVHESYIYDHDWDVLIILDGCRVDVLESLQHNHKFLPENINSIYSVASRSDMWMKRNFCSKFQSEMSETAYITGNPYSDDWVNGSDFACLEEVWRHEWDSEKGTVLPDKITDVSIQSLKHGDFSRAIIHYMQPHFPSIPEPIANGINIETFGSEWNSVWDLLENEEITEKAARSSYKSNLEFVLQSVHKLLDNIDEDNIIISADHANAFGEWNLYGHPINKPAPIIRRVPWVSVDATDDGSYTPEIDSRSELDDDVETKLESLGYV